MTEEEGAIFDDSENLATIKVEGKSDQCIKYRYTEFMEHRGKRTIRKVLHSVVLCELALNRRST